MTCATPSIRQGHGQPGPPRIALLLAGLVCPLLCGWAAGAQAQDDWLGRDKALHFSVSAGLAGASYGVGSLVLEERWQRALLAGSVSLSAGLAKEAYDWAGPGHASGRDLVWDLLGCLVGVGVAWLVDLALSDGPPPPRRLGALAPRDPRQRTSHERPPAAGLVLRRW